MTKQKTQTQNNYSTFYLTMLILTTVNFVFLAPSVFDIPHLVMTFSNLPFFVTVSLVDLLVSAAGVVGLIFLYQKQQRGYWIILAYAAMQIILTSLFLFSLGQVLDYYSLLSAPEGMSTEEHGIYSAIMYGVFYVIMAIGILYYATVGVLWHFAWKNQLLRDRVAKPTKK